MKNPKKAKWSIIVLFLLLVIITPFFFANDNKYPIKEIRISSTESTTLDIAYIPRWDEMKIYEQFSSYKDYSTSSKAISVNDVGNFIEETKLTGHDEYNPETNHGTLAEVYEVKGISKECAVALKFPGFDEFYVYTNHLYRPETLGEFCDTLSLYDNISFGTVYYDYFEGNKYRSFEFYGITKDDVWNYLIKDNLEAKNVHSDADMHISLMSISTNVDILGCNNISIAVTEDGYLTTNILATGKSFFIGKEKVDTFIEFVKNKLEGCEIVYVYEDEEDDTPEDSDTVSQIVSYNVETGEETVIEINLDTADSNETEASTESYSPPYIPD